MDARIWLKSGKDVLVEDLTQINNVHPDSSVESVTIGNFFIHQSCVYNFVGKTTISVLGEHIEYLEFI